MEIQSSKVKVSVIVPVYNAMPFFRECLNSICGQTLKEIEILCIDDGSDDGSARLMEDYAQKDSRIRVLYNRHTGQGAAGARNLGLAEAGGEYLAFLDADDYFDGCLLEKAYAKAVRLDADIVMYDAQRFENGTGRAIPTSDVLRVDLFPPSEVFSGRDYPRELFVSTIGAAWSMLFRREFIKEAGLAFQPLYHADDLFFSYAALAAAGRITYIDEKLLFYRKGNENSQSFNKNRTPLAALQACARLKEWLEERNLYKLYEQGFHNAAARYCCFYVETMERYDDFALLYEALKERYFYEFGFDKIREGELLTKVLYDWVKDVETCSGEEFLFKRAYGSKQDFCYRTRKRFPAEFVKPEERVIIYGAGDSGRACYIQNAAEGYCNVIGWVDREAARMYGPIEDVRTIKDKAFDKILIAIESRKAMEQVKRDLLSMGVKVEQMIWCANEKNDSK